MRELYFVKGKITVKPQGYWYTSGGEKGSFGYYPHLKEGDFPLYPDTQIHGDLRMAVSWLLKLKGGNPEKISKFFGDSPDQIYRHTRSKVFVTDLKPTKDSKFSFQVKPRTAIDEDRTNKEHMLVNFELAYYEDATLESEIYLAYFDSLDELNQLIELLKEAANLLSGFGGFRSRGYGRGMVRVEFEKPKAIKIESTSEIKTNQSELTLALKPLVNFRNRKVEAGKRQLVDTLFFIPSHQIRGWFIRTYKDLTGKWPTSQEISSIKFTDFYPSIYNKNNNFLRIGYPVPVTAVKFKDGTFYDLSKTDQINTKKKGREKPKPLGLRYFVTDEPKPKLIKIKTDARIRNSTEPNFATKEEGGLFTQEFVTQDNYFGGKIYLNGDSDFIKVTLMVLQNPDIKPIINGALFEKILTNEPSTSRLTQTSDLHLVVSPITLDRTVLSLIESDKNYHIKLATTRSYSVELRRPRRNRIVVDIGSIYPMKVDDKTINWQGFGRDLTEEE